MARRRRRTTMNKAYMVLLLLLAGVLALVLYTITRNAQNANQALAMATFLPYNGIAQPTSPPVKKEPTAEPVAVVATPQPAVVTSVWTPLPGFIVETPAPTAGGVLKRGAEGEEVRVIQRRLRELKYLSGSADGSFGEATESALIAFQKANGLSADGVAGPATLKKLNSDSAKSKPSGSSSSGGTSGKDTSRATSMPKPRTYVASEATDYRYLQNGSSGSDVKKLQNRLIQLGYMSGSASGSFDDETEEAVRNFQDRNGQWVDGVAGQDTQSMLFSSKALAARGSSYSGGND